MPKRSTCDSGPVTFTVKDTAPTALFASAGCPDSSTRADTAPSNPSG